MTPAVRPLIRGVLPAAGLLASVMALVAPLQGVRAAGTPVPVSVQSAPGRFEVSALDASVAHAVVAASEEAWRFLAGPLGLPEAFSSPIFVRVVPPEADGTPETFQALVEPGGIVSLRLSIAGRVGPIVRRALVQALLFRVGVARYGASEQINAPLWLEHAGVGWWRTHLDAAQLDALKSVSMALPPPPLEELLAWAPGDQEPMAYATAAVWLLTFLQAESGRAKEWPAFLQRLLGGEEPLAALAACFPDRFATAAERELWWQTGYHHVRRVRTLPMLEPREARQQLGTLVRFVFAGTAEDSDVVVPLREVLNHANDPVVAADLGRRATELARLIPALHPFYRNAGLALAEVLRDGVKVPVRREALCAAFEEDWNAAVELEAATTAALDALEKRGQRR